MTKPYVLHATGVNQALSMGLAHLARHGEAHTSRNGDVLRAPGPVITFTENPMERVLFSSKRDANPFFHLFESLWMLAGRNDLPWVAQFNSQMAAYSDDGGQTQPAAYGYRWRKYFGYDQLEAVIAELTLRPNSRRAVLTMWNGGGEGDNSILVGVGDLAATLNESKDVPCNTNCFFTIRDGEYLDMSVQCRSNDAIWGAHGANAVHFSVLLEYMAARLDLIPGVMYQYSFDYHLYKGVLKHPIDDVVESCDHENMYLAAKLPTTPLFDSETVGGKFERELHWFCEAAAPNPPEGIPGFHEPLFRQIAMPMLLAWRAHKAKDYATATKHLLTMPHCDWQHASLMWVQRRQARHEEKANG